MENDLGVDVAIEGSWLSLPVLNLLILAQWRLIDCAPEWLRIVAPECLEQIARGDYPDRSTKCS